MLMLCALAARAESYQFLVLLDASQSMASREASAARKVRELVRGGFQAQAQPGDVLDVWAFTSELKTNRFVTQLWNSSNHLAQAELAGRFVESEKFAGRTRFKSFADELNSWIARQPNALLFIVTDGEDAIVGLPNDLEINSYVSPRRGAARTARRTFLVGFKIQSGRVTEWLAHDGLGPVQLPRLPDRATVLPAVAAAEPISAEEPAKPAPEPPPAPVFDLPPGSVIVTQPPVVNAPEPAPKQEEAPAAVAVAEPPSTTVAETKTVELPAAPPRAEEPAKVEAAPVEAVAPKPAEPPANRVEPVPSPAATTNDIRAVAVAVPARRWSFYYVLGGGVAVLLLALVLRRRPTGEKASLISKSLSRK